MKKILVKLLVLASAALALGGCAGNKAESVLKDGQSDIEYVKSKGTLKIGVTDYAPMDFPTENGDWDGFDAQLAKLFAEELGVAPEFVEIDWNKKADLLTDGTIDVVWNGMTFSEELAEEIDCTDAYMSNSQVVVMRKDKIDQYKTIDECQHLLFAVENGSAGNEIVSGLKYRYTAFETQKDTLSSVMNATADCAVIDIIMAGYYTADGKEFSDLGYRFPLNEEQICVGFRKGSDITAAANEFLKETEADGKMTEIARQYGIEGAVLT